MRKRKNVLIIMLCFVLVFMGIGYATLSQILNIRSTANVTGDFNIIIDDMRFDSDRSSNSVNGEIQELPKNTTASYTSTFNKPLDYITYDVTVKNLGSIKGILQNVEVIQKASDDMLADLTSRGVTLDDVFETKTYEANSFNDIALGHVLDVDGVYNFDIRTTLKDIDFLPVGEMTTEIRIIYGQVGNPDINLDTDNPGGEIVDDYTGPDIEVNEVGLLTKIKTDKFSNNGWLVLPSTATDGKPIVSIDRNSFLKYNAAEFCDYNEETGEDSCGIIIYDENHFDQIKEIIMERMDDDYGYGGGYYGSPYYSSNNLLGKITPSELINSKGDSPYIKKLSGYGSGSGTHDLGFVRASEITLSKNAEMDAFYVNLQNGRVEEAQNMVEKLDLTRATNLTTIKPRAFEYTQLSEIKLGSSITSIEEYAFSGGQLSGELILPSSLSYIGEGAFSRNQISKVTIPSSVTTIGYEAFYGNEISSFTLGDGITTIGDAAFRENQIMGELDLSNLTRLNNVGNYTFEYNQITNVVFPANLTTIGNSTFEANQISEVTIPSGITSIGPAAFARQNYDEASGQYLGLSKANVAKYFSGMFGYNKKISELIINSGEIGSNEFSDAGITKLTLGEGVTSIGERAFENNRINELTNLSQTSTVGAFAFANQNYDEASGKYLGINKVTIGKYNRGLIQAFTNLSSSYDFNISELVIRSGAIDQNAFHNQGNSKIKISKLTLGDGVTSIGNNAFSSLGITTLTFGSGITSIGNSAFYQNQISELTIPNSVVSIGENAFQSNGMHTLTLQDGLTSIENNAFAGNQITQLSIPSTVTSIGEGAFRGNQIGNLSIENSVTAIGMEAFRYNQIDLLSLGNNITSIGNGAFAENQISSLIIPPTVTSIEPEAFYANQISGELDLINLTNLISLDGFRYNQITGLNLSSSVLTIGGFESNQISKISIPSGVTTIKDNAFMRNQISSLTIPSSVTSIGMNSFNYNPLTSINIQRTQQDFETNVSLPWSWYDGTPTITYQT